MKRKLSVTLGLLMLASQVPGYAAPANPWDDKSLDPDKRADLVLKQMTLDEKITVVDGLFGSVAKLDGKEIEPVAGVLMGSAGHIPGVPRLGIPSQEETDAGLGVATQGNTRDKVRERTSLPAGLATAATWNPELAYQGGAMIGSEARLSGFNVMLAGGVNLTREPRNGRNFEYAGEDPLLAGTIAGATIKGVQSNHIVSTIKHFAENDQETGRMVASANIDDDQGRMSDLLAFQFAIEAADPGSVMCSYNRVHAIYACENDVLLNQILKKDWGYKGYVMSDWGADHSTAKAINAGLDQESAWVFDGVNRFGDDLRKALSDKSVSPKRLDEMVRRILRTLFAKGVIDDPVKQGPIDYAKDSAVTQADAEEAIVLLKNDGNLLPVKPGLKRIVVIGGHADVGVPAGGGSSLVYPVGGNAFPGIGPTGWPGPVMFHPSSPVKALKSRLGQTEIAYADGADAAAAAKLATGADLVLVFARNWDGEDHDEPLTLPDNQDALIASVAAANAKTVVVLETGNPVLMPWIGKVQGVVEAWYSGTSGGEAIARVLTGEADASGRLPITFPASLDQLPHPKLVGSDVPPMQPFDLDYPEGAATGYKWYDRQGLTPAFPFGFGLSYSSYAYENLSAKEEGGKVTVSFTVKNTGARAGKDVPQIYVGHQGDGWEAPRRLAGWQKVALAPGESKQVSLTVDPRLLAHFDGKQHKWVIAKGAYELSLGSSSRSFAQQTSVTLEAKAF
jgi:beta-glucosidase